MKKRLFFKVIPIFVLVCGMIFLACSSDGDGGGGGGGDPFSAASLGSYSGTGEAAGHTVYISDGGWSIMGPELNDSGDYTLSGDSRTATLMDVEGITVGTATISGRTLRVTFNAASGYPGTYTATKN